MDRRWQLVLNCLDCDRSPFSKGTLVAFRQRLIAQQMDRRLLERTLDFAATSGAFGPRQLRAALDSSPLWGAGRVEDTYNLLGHALRKALGVIARQQGRGLPEVACEAGAPIMAGASLKAALDLDWDAPGAQQQALRIVLDTLEAVEGWLDTHAGQCQADTREITSLVAAHQVYEQDVTTTSDGTPHLRQGVAEDRRISIEDAEMRHGRKSRSLLIDGYKRHVLRDLDSGLSVAVGLTPANAPEASVTDAIETDLAAQQSTLKELHIDRAYLASTLVQKRPADLAIFCKAWPVRQGPYFPKTAFVLDWEQQVMRCPGGEIMPFEPGGVVKFPATSCASCTLRERCTTSASGRSVSIHPDEALLQELRARQLTPQGRARLRERVAVEHAWPMWAAGKADVRATMGCGKMCLICGGVLSCIIYTCWHASLRWNSKWHEYLTDVLGLIYKTGNIPQRRPYSPSPGIPRPCTRCTRTMRWAPGRRITPITSDGRCSNTTNDCSTSNAQMWSETNTVSWKGRIFWSGLIFCPAPGLSIGEYCARSFGTTGQSRAHGDYTRKLNGPGVSLDKKRPHKC